MKPKTNTQPEEGKDAKALGIVLEDYHAELVARGYDPEKVAIHAAMENILF